MSRGRGQGVRAISKSFPGLLFALTGPLAGWSGCWVPPKGGCSAPSLAVPGAEGPQLGLGAGGGKGSSVKLLCLLPKLMDPPIF